MKIPVRSKIRSATKPVLSIIIVSYKVGDLLKDCINSIFENPLKLPFEVIVVDNASSDGTLIMLKDSFPNVTVIVNDTNVGFSRANNIGIEASQGEFVLLLNPDTIVLPGTLDKMLKFMQCHPNIGVMGCRLIDEHGNTQPSCGRYPTPRLAVPHLFGLHKRIHKLRSFYMSDWNHSSTRFVDWVCAACFLTRRKIINKIGPLDESLFLYGEEMDWCLRMSVDKWKTAYYHEAAIIHYGGESIAQIKNTTVIDRTNYMTLYVSLHRYFSKFHGRATTNTLWFVITALIFLNVIVIVLSPFVRPHNYATRLRKATALLRIAFVNMRLIRQ
jgi:GT2 family glycosyltransferase